MASVPDVRWCAFDAQGNAYSGALLYIFDTGTTNLSSIYSNSGLTVAASNPLTADANGLFAQWYAPEAALYDIQVKTSGGVLLRSYVAVAAVGTDSGSLTRDFGTSRFAARGSGGVTYVEAGDASPDNIGGHMSLGGWAGTQADEIDANALLFNIVGGRFKEQGYKLDGTVRSENVTFSNVASVAIPLTNDPTGVRVFEVDIFDLSLASNSSQVLALTLSFDGGVTYASADYAWNANTSYGTTGTISGAGPPQSLAEIVVSTLGGAGAPNIGGLVRMTVMTVNSGNNRTIIMGQAASPVATAVIMNTSFSAAGPASAGRCTHIKLASGSNLTGAYRVRPLRGFGET